jgi:hypothetical protein
VALPTDDVLMTTECNIVSRCDLCGTNIDASHHIFLHCRFAGKIWQWFSFILNMQVADNILKILCVYAIMVGINNVVRL